MEQKKASSLGCRINLKLLPLKMTYFLLLAAYAALLPYLPVFMGVLKLTPIEMSLILGTATAVSAPIRLIVGYMADRFEKRETIFTVTALLTLMFHLSLYFTPVKESGFSVVYDESPRGRLCSNSRHLTLESFNETLFIINNVSKEFGRNELRCCLEDVKNGSKCFDMSFNNSDEQAVVYNISTVEQWFSLWNLKNSDESFCIDLQFCSRTMYLESEASNNHNTFWKFFVLYMFAQGTCSPLMNILDSLVFTSLIKYGNPTDFGKTFSWGTIAYGIIAFVSGLIQDGLINQGWKGKDIYIFNFVNFAIGMFLTAIMMLLVKVTIKITNAGSGETGNNNLKIDHVNSQESEVKLFKEELNVETQIFKNKKELMRILCGFYLSIVIMTGMISGILAGCIEGFFYYFLASLDPDNKSVLGICLAVSCAGETIVLIFSGRILSVLGSKRCLYLIFFVFLVRFLASSYIENPWYGMFVEATSSICYGLLYPVMTSWASSLVPAQLQSTVQCYLGAIYFSLGRAVGTGTAGTLYEQFGPRVTFQIFAAISGGYLIVLVFTFEVLDRIRQKKVHKDDTKACSDDTKVSVIKVETVNKTSTHL